MQASANKNGNPLACFYKLPKVFLKLCVYAIIYLILPTSLALADKSTSVLKAVKTKPPARVLSLDLCTDWMLAKYAKQSQVLALSPLTHQYSAPWIDTNWPTHDGSLEQILELKPDLVITGEYNALILRQRLQELGIKVAILKLPRNLAQLTEYEKHFLSLIGASAIPIKEPKLTDLNTNSPDHPPRLLLLGANGIGTGQQTFENDIILHAGWNNYLRTKGYVSLDLEQIAADPPDAILWSGSTTTALSNLFAQHSALKQAIPKNHWLTTEHWKWRCPGPWTWDLVHQLHALLPNNS